MFCCTACPSRGRGRRGSCPGSAVGRVGGAGERAEALDAALALDDDRGDRAGRHELDERLEERLALVLGVVRVEALDGRA